MPLQPVHGTAIYRCDDTRGCIVQFWPGGLCSPGCGRSVCSGGSWWRFKVLGVQTSGPHTNRPVKYSIDHTDKHLHNTVYSHYTHTHTYTSYYLILYSAENHMLQLNIWCSWWWAYVPETCRAKNTLVKSPCCIKLAFQIISLEVYLLVVCGCDV